MNVMKQSPVEHDDSRLHDESEVNENQRNSIQANSTQGNKTRPPNEGGFSSRSKDPNLEDEDELSRLKALATDVREQVDLERDVGRQVR